MPLFDTSIWSFCKSNWDTYIDFLKESSGTDTAEIEKRKANFEQMVEAIMKKKDEYLEQIVSYGRMSPKHHAMVKEKVAEYDKQIEDYRSSILREQEKLEVISRSTDLSDTELALETSKEDMRKYIQILVKSIILIHRTDRLIVIEVKLNPGVVVSYTTQETSKPSTDVPIYLLVDGIQGNAPKLRCVYSPSITFDADNGIFKRGEQVITTKDVLEDREDLFSRELLFRRLKIYQNDVPKKKA